MTRSFLGLSALALCAAIGCGSLASRNSSIATVSGQLSGANVPANTRVAIVWHSPNKTWIVSQEAAVVGGAYSIDLTGAPPDELFFTPSDTSNSVSEPTVGSSTPPSAGPTASADTSGSGSGSGSGAVPGSRIAPRDVVSGSVSSVLSVAVAGFVLYVDSNGNGKLDIADDNAGSPDQIVGGSNELMLVYMRDGSSLDFEKLRDSTNQLPSRGYDLAWTQKGRWVPLSSADLKLGTLTLPGDVCKVSNISGGGSVSVSPNVDAPPPEVASGGTVGGSGTSGSTGDSSYAWGSGQTPAPSTEHGPYPAAGDPNLSCARDGRSWTYSSCRTTSATPAGMCGQYHIKPCDEYGVTLGSSHAIPDGWPCPVTVTTEADASVAPTDAGTTTDAGH